MRRARILSLTLVGIFAFANASQGDPPDHAPAHGRRAKDSPVRQAESGVSVVFDSDKGLHVAVGLPGVFFHQGHYYRQAGSRWEISAKGDGGWGFVAVHSVPDLIRKTHKSHPAKAKHHKRKHKKKSKR